MIHNTLRNKLIPPLCNKQYDLGSSGLQQYLTLA